jgi:hypothetical protein
MSEKNEKLASQLGTIQKELLKWNSELDEFANWDVNNNGVLENAEKLALEKSKKDIVDILCKIKAVSSLKGLNLALAESVEKLLTKQTFVIPKPKFGSEMKAWIGMLRDNLSLLKDDNTPLKTDLLRSEIKNSFAKDPVNMFLANHISSNISGNTRGEIAKSLIDALSEMFDDNYWETWFSSDKTWRNAYKKDQSINNHLPNVLNFSNYFSAQRFENKSDLNHPENKKLDEAEFLKFKDFIISSIANEKNNIEAIAINGDSGLLDLRIIDASLLKENKIEISSAAYSTFIKESIFSTIIAIADGKKLYSVREIKAITKDLLTEFSTENSIRGIYAKFKENKNYSFPSGFSSWINQSAVSIDLKSFEKHFKTAWADKVISAVDSFQKDMKSKGTNFMADRTLIDNNLKRILSVGIGKNNSQPGLEIHKLFMKSLPTDKILSYTVIDSVWEKAISESVKPEFMSALSSKYFNDNK